MPVERRREIYAYTLINYNRNEHRFEEQDLERHGEYVIEPMSNVDFIRFLGCIILAISCLLPYPLSLSDKEDRPIGFGNSKKYQDQAETGLKNDSLAFSTQLKCHTDKHSKNPENPPPGCTADGYPTRNDGT